MLKYLTIDNEEVNTRLYVFTDLIRGSYWLFWIAIDIFVLFQIYYDYRSLYVGMAMLAIFFVSSYFEFKLYMKLLDALEKRLN